MAQCRRRVGQGVVTFSCAIDIPAGAAAHEGPCAAFELPHTERARTRWLDEQEAERRRTVLTEDLPTETWCEIHSGFREPGQPACVIRTGSGWGVRSKESPDSCRFVNFDQWARATGLRAGDLLPDPGPTTAQEWGLQAPDGYEPTKQREGDQRLPIPNGRPLSHEQMIEDITERLATGIRRYGVGLQAMNGRDTFRDAYEEALDLGVYLRTLIEERKEMLALVEEALAALVSQTGDPVTTVRDLLLLFRDWLRQ